MSLLVVDKICATLGGPLVQRRGCCGFQLPTIGSHTLSLGKNNLSKNGNSSLHLLQSTKLVSKPPILNSKSALFLEVLKDLIPDFGRLKLATSLV